MIPSRRAHGLAVFAGATFAIGLASVIALDRVGAPEDFVKALGPILALATLAILGVGARTADLANFVAAGRALPPFYGGLSLVAVGVGFALCLTPDPASDSSPSLVAVFAGAALGAVGLGPLVRQFGATSIADVIATRFSSSPLRWFSAAVFFATASLTAVAGYRVAASTAETLLLSSRAGAEALVAAVLAASAIPGGLASVVWCSSATAGGLVVILALAGIVGTAAPAIAPGPTLAEAHTVASSHVGPWMAMTIATAGFFVFHDAAVASRNVRASVEAGMTGVLLGIGLIVLAIMAPDLVQVQDVSSPATASFAGAAALAASLALARAGVQGASRAFGAALSDPPRPFPPLASVRLARMRLTQAAVVLGCVACDMGDVVDSQSALVLALSLSLAFTTPLVALAAIERVGPLAASLGLVAGVAAAALERPSLPLAASPLLQQALVAGAATFLVGALASLAAPRRGPPTARRAFDPFLAGSG